MKLLRFAVLAFITIHFIRIDLLEGTIPPMQAHEQKTDCQMETNTIMVTSIKGDTIASLFALYPDPESSFIDRLQLFYELNPSFKHQDLIEGYTLYLPLSTNSSNNCKK